MFARDIEPALVAEGVVRLGTDLVSWYLLEDAGRVVLVDAGLPGYERQLERGLAVLGARPADVSAVVLTHSHSDHVGAAEQVRRELGAPVYVHAAEAEATRTAATLGKTGGSQVPYLRHGHAWRLLAHFAAAGAPEPVAEVQAYEDGDALPGGLRAVLTEGHTPGHCVLHQPSRGLLFAADLICTRNPLTGGRGPELLPRPLNTSSEQMLASLARIEPLEAGTVLFGHGEPWTHGTAAAVKRAREIGLT